MPVSRTHAPRTHEARTDVRRKPGTTRQIAGVSGTAGLRFRAFAGISRPERHRCKGTANAVGWQHPPGFKSPILCCDQQFRPGAPSEGTAGFRFAGPLCGHGRNLAAHLHPLPAPPRGPQPCPETGAARPHNQSAGRDVCRWFALRARHSVRSAKAGIPARAPRTVPEKAPSSDQP